jgi:hypothetical protein
MLWPMHVVAETFCASGRLTSSEGSPTQSSPQAFAPDARLPKSLPRWGTPPLPAPLQDIIQFRILSRNPEPYFSRRYLQLFVSFHRLTSMSRRQYWYAVCNAQA